MQTQITAKEVQLLHGTQHQKSHQDRHQMLTHQIKQERQQQEYWIGWDMNWDGPKHGLIQWGLSFASLGRFTCLSIAMKDYI